MARLPMLGGDGDQWGAVLNDFLRVGHREDGALRGTYTVANVKDFGAQGDGITDDTLAIQAAIYSLSVAEAPLSTGGVVYFPVGVYLVNRPVGILLSVPNLVLLGNTQQTSTLRAGPACEKLLQTQAVPLRQAGTIEIHNLTLDGYRLEKNAPSLPILLAIDGGVTESVYIRRCAFHRFDHAAIFQAGRNVIIEHCTFNNFGKGTGAAIKFDDGFEDITISGCRFLWSADGIMVVTGKDPITSIAQNITIEDNYFDLGWYTLPATLSNSGLTVSYTASTIEDSAADFSNVGNHMYFRVMPTRRTGTISVSTKTSLSDASASFQTDGIIVGEIIRVQGVAADEEGSLNYNGFAVISAVISQTQIQVEEWLDDMTREPLALPPPGARYTVYGVYLGRTGSAKPTRTRVTMFGDRWFDLNGQTVTPAAGTLYEFLPKPNYPIHLEPGARTIKILHNTVKRGYSDQISVWGDAAIITGNHVLWGQDMGITLNDTENGGHSIVANNRLYKSGIGGIFVTAKHSIVANNIIEATTWVDALANSGITPVFGLGAISVGGTDHVVVLGNICDGQSLPQANVGIVIGQVTNVSLSANIVTRVNRFGVNVVAQAMNLRSAIDNDFWSVPIPINHQDNSHGGGLYDLQGSESPEGRFVAAPGSTYRDVINGQLYVKRTGTGVNGWMLVQTT